MTEKDWDTLAAFEKAIAEKYGAEAIQNPKANWDETKEEEYLEPVNFAKRSFNAAFECARRRIR